MDATSDRAGLSGPGLDRPWLDACTNPDTPGTNWESYSPYTLLRNFCVVRDNVVPRRGDIQNPHTPLLVWLSGIDRYSPSYATSLHQLIRLARRIDSPLTPRVLAIPWPEFTSS